MRLTTQEKKIISAVQHNADASIAAISKATGYRAHTIRHYLSRLKERGVLVRMTTMNSAALGYINIEVLFSTGLRNQKDRDKLLELLKESQIVEVILEVGGEFEYDVIFCVRDSTEISDFFHELGEQFGDVFFGKAVALKQHYFGFGRKYLSSQKVSPVISLPSAVPHAEIDETDHRILKELTKLGIDHFSTVARTVGLPENTLQYRIKRLIKEGVIVRFIYGVDMSSEDALLFRLLLYSNSYTQSLRSRVYDFCAAHRQIVNLSYSLGAWDYEIGVEVLRQEDLQQVIREIQASFGSQISRVSVLPVFRIPKVRNYPFKTFKGEKQASHDARYRKKAEAAYRYVALQGGLSSAM